MRETLQAWARGIRRDAHAVFLAARDPRVPWYAKALAILVAGYAFSPLDLIPDFIPVFGYVDDLILVPLGIWAVIKLIPPEVMNECRRVAAQTTRLPVSRLAALVIAIVWLCSIVVAAWLAFAYLTR